MAENPLPPDTLLNINFPPGAPSGVEVTHLGKRLYDDEMKLVDQDPDTGRHRYQIYGYEPSSNGTSSTQSGERVVMLRACALRLESGATT